MISSLSASRVSAVVFCLTGLAIILAMVLSMNGLGPLDDHRFVSTLFQGKSFDAYVSPELGRFIPLTAQEYGFVAKFVEPTPFLFYALGAIKVLLAGGLLFYCLSLTGARNLAVVVLWSVVALSIGFANAAFRLQVGELNALVLILIFIWSVLVSENEVSSNSGRRRVVVAVGLLALSMAHFYKELIFVFALAFAVSEIVRKYRQGRSAIPRYLWVLLAVGTCYISAYALWRAIYVTGSYASFHAVPIWQIARYYAENDPFIVLVVLPLTAFRLMRFVRDSAGQTIFDSMLIAAMAYFVAYLALGVFNTYYLLPAYGFAACGVAGLSATRFARAGDSLVLLLVGMFTANTAPIAISDMQTLKLTANNHYRFMQVVSEWIRSHPLPNAGRRNLVLAGVSPGAGVEILVSFKTYLTSLGTPESVFEVKATEPSDNKTISDFHGFKSPHGYLPVAGDLLIFNPYRKVDVRPPLQAPSYQEIYRSERAWAPPRWMVWHWLKLCLPERAECTARLFDHRRYVGYAAMLLTRAAVAVSDPHPLESPAYRLDDLDLPTRLRAGIAMRLDVMVRNTGMETWPADGALHPGMFVHLAYRWLDRNGQVILEGDRVPFPEPMRGNDVTQVALVLKTPALPGKYILAIGPVQEGVRWFAGVDEREVEIY